MTISPRAGTTGASRVPQKFRVGVIATFLPLLAAWLLSRWVFDFHSSATALLFDTLLVLPAMLLATRAVRGPLALCVLGVLFAAAFVFSHATKIASLGMPVSFMDFQSGLALLKVLRGPRLLLAIGVAAIFFTTLAWALWPRRGGLKFLLAMLGYLLLLPLLAQPMATVSARMRNDAAPRDAMTRLQQDGGTLFLFQDLGTRLWSRTRVLDAGVVARALRGRTPAPQLSNAPYRTRNIHLVLLEAFWDPMQLKAYRFSRDPLDPRLRALWRAGGHSAILSPVFGGATANAEFEVLCGLPASDGEVVFEQALAQSIPCMPRVLREAGYLTIASHPYQSDYWNRDEAYPLLGFERYNAIGAFKLDDMDGMFLNDASTYRQILERLDQLPGNRPYFSYVVSLSTHYPFHRDGKKRPGLVEVMPEAPLLQAYANALAYSSSTFMDYVEAIRSSDPEALIVAFGDHAPVLGPDPDPYRRSGIPIRGEAADLVRISTTPLLVIDGRRGSVPMGTIPLYALPARILSLLGKAAPNLPYAGVTGGEAADSRQFMASTLVRGSDGWRKCDGAQPAGCSDARHEQARLETLREDLTRGRQSSLAMLDAQRYSGDVTMQRNDAYGECALKVKAWGPTSTPAGMAFNVQPTGKSAIWMKLDDARGHPVLLIGDDEAPVTLAGNTGSATYRDPRFLQAPGRYPVRYRCGSDGEPVPIGTFTVTTR